MKAISTLLLVGGLMLTGCELAERIENGKMTRNGNFFYELCERGKERTTDMKSMSFELPELFKQAPCTRWSGYVYSSTNDELNVSIPSVITHGNLMAIGLGGHSMAFRPGIFYSDKEQKWKYSVLNMPYSPEVFLKVMAYVRKAIEHGFVDVWSGGRCGRILSGAERSLDYIHEVEYYCWPYSSGDKRQVPFYIRASQSIPKKREGIPPKSDFTDLDNQLIKPVLDSLIFNPLPDEAFQMMADNFLRICNLQQNAFFNKIESNSISIDFPDRRIMILGVRDCGYDVPLPKTRIDSYNEIFEKTRDEKLGDRNMGTGWIPKDYQLIEIRFPQGGRISYEAVKQRRKEDRYYVPTFNNGEVWTVYKISREKFSRIKQKLLALDVLKETEPVTRKVGDPKQKGRGIHYIDLPYDAWYYVPPEYKRTLRYGIEMQSHRAGFGFRYDQELNANVIDINFKDPQTISTYYFVTLVEGD